MPKTKKRPAATDKTNKILVVTILDRSGSMSSNRDGTISGYNEFINGLRQDKKSEYSVTLTQFDAPVNSPELTVTYDDRALADVQELTQANYEPRGNTPLYDAIGECVRRIDAKGRGVIVLIITDGLENASQEFTKDSIQKLIKEKEGLGWTFSFLGANIDSYAEASKLGVAGASAANYNPANAHALYATLATATMSKAAEYRSVGALRASAMPMFSASMKQAMMAPATPDVSGAPPSGLASANVKPTGGRPAVPQTFHVRRTKWTTKSA